LTADKTDVIMALWRNVAIPAMLYSIEVVELNEATLKDIEHWQCVIGKVALQVPTSTANEFVYSELGLKPIKMLVSERRLNYFSKITNDKFIEAIM